MSKHIDEFKTSLERVYIHEKHVGSSGLRIIKRGGGVELIIPKPLQIKNLLF